MRWLEVRVTVAAAAAEAVGEKLREMGARGFATEDVGQARALVAYFPVMPEGSATSTSVCARETASAATRRPEEELRAFLARLPEWGLPTGPADLETRLVDEAAWRDQWKAYFHPRRVGRRLVVHPPWEEPSGLESGELTIDIDPGQAFGTGTHATTRGALELLEEAVDAAAAGRPVRQALDLGTGSGILAIAAARLGIPEVLAVDNDPVAVEAARENVRRNGVGRQVKVVLGDAFAVLAGEAAGPGEAGPGEAGPGEADPGEAGPGEAGPGEADPGEADPRGTPLRRVDLVLANLTTDLVVTLAPAVAKALPGGGLFIAAGVSSGEGEATVREAALAAGFGEVDRRTGEGWTSFLFRKGETGRGGRTGRAVFYTLGCKANLYDTAGMMTALRRAGWDVVARGEDEAGTLEGPPVDLCVINSCAVTARAEAKSRQLARKLKREHPGALVALVGCYPQVRRDDAAATAGVDLVLGTEDRGRLAEVLAERGYTVGRAGAGEGIAPVGEAARPEEDTAAAVASRPEEDTAAAVATGPEEGAPVPGAFAGERTRAAVKVQDGCEQFCTYCIIPYARGPSRSRPAAEVLDEVTRLVRAGFREVVLTGIHLGAWGADLGSRPSPADLVREIAAVPGLYRVRLSSIEPMEVTDDLIELMATNPHVCRHLHVPLQSGSDRVLERMNRHYTAADYLAMVQRVRERVPLVGLTTDVMVGFPGETDEDFGATLEVVRRARFSRLHVFRFSRRPGTPAAEMPGQVDAAVKKARSGELIRLGRRLAREFHQSLVGLTLEVLVEKARTGKDGRAEPTGVGFTDNYVRVTFSGPNARVNEAVPVRLERVTPDGLVGSEDRPGLAGRG